MHPDTLNNNTSQWKKCLRYLCLASTIFATSLAQNSEVNNRKQFDWGIVESSTRDVNTRFIITLKDQHNIHIGEINNSANSPRQYTSKLSFQKYTFFYALPPYSKATLKVNTERSTRIDPGKINVVSGYKQLNDSSSISLVYSTYSTSIAAEATPALKIEGYEWYRGLRLAKISVWPYTRNGGEIMQRQTIDASLELESRNDKSSVYYPSSNSNFTSVLMELIANPSDLISVGASSLVWSDTTGDWITYNANYLKLAVPNDGIYRINYDDLAQWYNGTGSIDPKTFRLFNKGVELPIYVQGEDDNVFSKGDYIEFVGQKNYSNIDYHVVPTGDQEYPELMNRYTDTSYYWLEWNVKRGIRFTSNLGVPVSTDTLKWFTERVHIEKNNFIQLIGNNQVINQDPRWLSGDVWAWGWIFVNSPFEINFQAHNISSEYPNAKIFVKYASWGAENVFPAHKVRLQLNSVDSVQMLDIAQYQQVLMQPTILTNQLVNNGSNFIRLLSLPTASSRNFLLFDWAEVEYPRILKVESDSLLFSFDNIGITRTRKVVIYGLTKSTFSIYKYAQVPKQITNYVISEIEPYSVSFDDTIGGGDKYIICTTEYIKTPINKGLISFKNLRDSQRKADYIVLTDSSLFSIAGTYARQIGSRYNLTTSVIGIQDVFNEFGYGYPVPESIRELLKATTKWQPPMPSFVLLAGDATYDTKRYVNIGLSRIVRKNLVPAFGYPVSDTWFTVLDDSSIIPQMFIGRIPVQNEDEFGAYLKKVESYFSKQNDDWNKRYLFFSGGDINEPQEIVLFKNANNKTIDSIVTPPPTGGIATHFFKTVDPVSDYGPYSAEVIQNTISNGAVMITYIGHSGTQTWDNGIGDISQLANSRGRYSVISDYGCSTAKFAEPDIKCFGELFTIDTRGCAIAYIGNSALGFTSIALNLPYKFFNSCLVNGINQIGKSHLLSKIALMNELGGPGPSFPPSVNRIMMLTNTLLGDPAIEIDLPRKPNISIKSSDILISPSRPTDDDKILTLLVPYLNTGLVIADSFEVRARHQYYGSVYDTTTKRVLPNYSDTVKLVFSIKDQPGRHDFTIDFNQNMHIAEIRQDDNQAVSYLFVSSNVMRSIRPYANLYTSLEKFIFLNPTNPLVSQQFQTVMLEIDTVISFTTCTQSVVQLGKVVTCIRVQGLIPDKRYYWRAKIIDAMQVWSEGTSIHLPDSITVWSQPDSLDWRDNFYENTSYFSGVGAKLEEKNYSLKIISSGFNDGGFCSVEINGLNALPSTFGRGFAIVILDTTSITVKQTRFFDNSNTSSSSWADSLAAFLSQVSIADYIAATIIGDGQPNLNENAKNAFRNIGSYYIDSVQTRDSWCILGFKNAQKGSVLESYMKRYTGKAIIDTVFVRKVASGSLLSPEIGPASRWNQLKISRFTPDGSLMTTSVIGIQMNGKSDTIVYNIADTLISLAQISAKEYPKIRLLESFQSNQYGNSPLLTDWKITLDPAAELAINYQSITVSSDSVLEGDPVIITASVYNYGQGPVDSVFVALTAIELDRIRSLDTVFIPSIPADSFQTILYTYETAGKRGSNTIFVEVDPMQRIAELYKINNIYSAPVYVITDTVNPSFDITFDGKRIFDGDYVMPHPTIRIVIYDNSTLQIQNPSLINLTLDDRRITLGMDSDSLFETRTGPEKAIVTVRPKLRGRRDPYKLMVDVQDSTGNNVAMPTPLYFFVDSTWSLRNVFNYPNPFASETYFTFVLTDYIDEVEIKVYTINGRLIYDIKVPPQSDHAYYKVYWNGRDQDGDEIANGVYFYKIIAKVNGSTKEVIQKLAKIR